MPVGNPPNEDAARLFQQILGRDPCRCAGRRRAGEPAQQSAADRGRHADGRRPPNHHPEKVFDFARPTPIVVGGQRRPPARVSGRKAQDRGIGKGDVVGIFLPMIPDFPTPITTTWPSTPNKASTA